MKKQTFLKGSLILMASAIAAKVLGAVFKIPLTNMLGGVGMSYFSCAYSLFMPFYALIVTGITSAVAKLVASSAALGMYSNALRIRRVALVLFSVAGVPASLLLAAFAVPFSIYSVGSTEGAASIIMIAPAVLFGCVTAVERGYYEGMGNMLPTALSQVAEGFVKVFAGLFLCRFVTDNSEFFMSRFPWVTDIRALAAAAGILGVTLSSLGAAAYLWITRLFSGHLPEGEKCLEGRRIIAKKLVREALPVGASAVVTNFTALIDMWTIIGILSHTGAYNGMFEGVSADEVPRFVYGSFSGIALTVFNLVPSVTNMLGKGALTCIASAREINDKAGFRRGSIQALLIAEIIAVPSAVGLGVTAPQVLGILFPNQTDEAAICISSLRLLMPAMVCLCVSFPLFSMLQAIGRAGLPLKIMILGTFVKLAGNLAFIPFWGVDGAAIATSVSYLVILAVSVVIYLRESGLRLEAAPFLKVGYAGAMCGGAAYLASGLFAAYGMIAAFAAALILGGGTYIAVLFLGFRGEFVHIWSGNRKSPAEKPGRRITF